MGVLRQPKPAKYFVALLFPDPDLLAAVENELTVILGPLDGRSEILPWRVSRYYEAEMGAGLWRRFVSASTLFSPAKLAAIKLQAQEVEEKFRCQEAGRRGRRVNVDPGYLEQDKIVLASTKNAAHRIYLESGIYGETTLLYYDGAYRACRHTYPDYAWSETIRFLTTVRHVYLEQLRHHHD